MPEVIKFVEAFDSYEFLEAPHLSASLIPYESPGFDTYMLRRFCLCYMDLAGRFLPGNPVDACFLRLSAPGIGRLSPLENLRPVLYLT